jgi:hypothetical protein
MPRTISASKVEWIRSAYEMTSGWPWGRRPCPKASVAMGATVRRRRPLCSTPRSIRLRIGAKRANSMGCKSRLADRGGSP